MNFEDFILNEIPKKDLWQKLKESEKPIILYGMGDGADKIINVLNSYGLTPNGVFASDEFVRGHSFRGYKVKKYSEICEEYDHASVLICFGARTDDLFERFSKIGERYDIYAPDVPVVGDDLFNMNFFTANVEKIRTCYESFYDNESKRVFRELIKYKLSGEIKYLMNCESDRTEDIKSLIQPNDDEIFFDLGAYNGDTVKEFIDLTENRYKEIFAVEPDIKSYKKLQLRVQNNDYQNVTCINCGIGALDETVIFSNKAGRMSSVGTVKGLPTEFRSIDSICKRYDIIPTYIKMDLEGGEESAIIGGKTAFAAGTKFLISAYHRSGDIFSLPLLIKSINPKYKLFLRKNKYVPAWDINLYAV